MSPTKAPRAPAAAVLLSAVLALAAGTSGCGRDDSGSGRAPLQRQAERLARQANAAGRKLPPLAPVETFLADGTAVPERVNAASLSLPLKSNVEGATFACRLEGAHAFAPCEGGDRLVFDALVSGASYGMAVRACATDGRCDETPLVVTFVVDRTAPPLVPSPPPSETAAQDPSLPVSGATGERTLQIGSAVTLAAPATFTVTSYATTKTTTGGLYMARRVGSHAGSAYQGEACAKPFEAIQTGRDGARYCVGAPSRGELAAGYGAKAMPWNHAEMVRGAGLSTEEKILVAAFDAEGDPTDGRLSIDATCARATARGTISVPLLPDFFAGPARRELFSWCQVQDAQGVWWWVGTFTAPMNPADPTGQRLTAIHSAAASLGLASAQMFAARSRDLFTALLTPLAP